jgi:prefoldin subunit 5
LQSAAFAEQSLRDDIAAKMRVISEMADELNQVHGQLQLHERRAREMREAIEAADDRPRETVPPSGEDDWKDGA